MASVLKESLSLESFYYLNVYNCKVWCQETYLRNFAEVRKRQNVGKEAEWVEYTVGSETWEICRSRRHLWMHTALLLRTALSNVCYPGQIPLIWKTSTIIPIYPIQKCQGTKQLQTSCTYIPCYEGLWKDHKDTMVPFTDGKLDPYSSLTELARVSMMQNFLFWTRCISTWRNHSAVQGFYLLTFCVRLIRCTPTFYLIAVHLILSYPISS